MPGKRSSVGPQSYFRRSFTIGLAVVSAMLVAFCLRQDVGNVEAPEPEATVVAEGVRSPELRTTAAGSKIAAVSEQTPVSLGIPAIGVSADITSLGLNADKTVEVPKDPDDAGWYDRGARPGDNGSAVILGHVDSTTGPAVFRRLKTLERGDRVAVTLSDRTVAHYQVARVAQYANEDFPATKVYDGPRDRPALNLVTCGGRYDRSAGGYQANVVVYTTYLWATGGVR